MIDTNWWEIGWTACALAGVLAQSLLLRDNLLNFRALGGSTNGRRKINEFHLTSALGLLWVHLVFLYGGVRVMFTVDPPAFTPDQQVLIAGYMSATVALVLVGLNDLRVRHTVRND